MGFLRRTRQRREARRIARHMRATGDYSEFEELVAQLSDEDIEEMLAKLDKAINFSVHVATDPLTVNEYRILVEERRRREEHGA